MGVCGGWELWLLLWVILERMDLWEDQWRETSWVVVVGSRSGCLVWWRWPALIVMLWFI
jgi:hypothetical protein